MEEERTKTLKKPLLGTQLVSKGGFKVLPFIIANEALEKVASYGLLPNMILYLTREYKMESSQAATVLFLWLAATNFSPVVGALLGDSYVGRYEMIAFGSIASLLGMVFLWLTSVVPQLKCASPTSFQLMYVYSSFLLMSIGSGGIRSCSLAFGADQIDNANNVNNAKILESYISWYYVSTSLSAVIALTGVVYIQDHMGWQVGFGVPVVLMSVSVISFFLASPFYCKRKVDTSLLPRLARVLVSSFKNRNVELPSHNTPGLYHQEKGSLLHVPSEKLRFLNKACIIGNRESFCTVNQVEELKALIRVIPIWSSCIMMTVVIGQSFLVLQLSSMDRHVTRNFEIPAGSFSAFMVLPLTLWIILYDRIVLPVASRIAGRPVRIGVLKRMGTGLVFSTLSAAAVAIVEQVRRETAIKGGVSMSAMWMVPHYVLGGLAEAFNAVGQMELYYSELPKSMSCLASALVEMGLSFGSVTASLIVRIVDDVSGKGGGVSWVSTDINKGHYDYYYWLLAGLSSVNFLYFLACCKAFGPCKSGGGKKVRVSDRENNVGDQVNCDSLI